MSKQGFVQLHRKIQDHWLYQEERKFSKFEAWIDLIMMANHKENKFLLGNEFVHVKRGQFITSIRKLEKRWNWSNTKVISFLNILQDDKMIEYKSDTKKTVISIDKYDFYHDKDKEKHHENDTKTTRKHTNNNVKNVKNVEEDIPYAEIVTFLNEKAGKKFKHTTPKTKDLIKTRWNEGFRLDDFKKVIDIKNDEWKNDQKMSKFIRPETLFSPKFEGYLNQETNNKGYDPDNDAF